MTQAIVVDATLLELRKLRTRLIEELEENEGSAGYLARCRALVEKVNQWELDLLDWERL